MRERARKRESFWLGMNDMATAAHRYGDLDKATFAFNLGEGKTCGLENRTKQPQEPTKGIAKPYRPISLGFYGLLFILMDLGRLIRAQYKYEAYVRSGANSRAQNCAPNMKAKSHGLFDDENLLCTGLGTGFRP